MDILKPINSIAKGQREKHAKKWDSVLLSVKKQFESDILFMAYPGKDYVEIPVIGVTASQLVSVLTFLKEHENYDFLTDLTATDEHPRSPRFDIVYQLMSTKDFSRLRIKVSVDEQLATVTVVYPSADWAEREVFDMFGIVFEKHPHLRRILMHESWQGHPLRKDYPLRGYQVITHAQMPDSKKLEV